MTLDQIALQLYTLRDHCRTPADFASTCRKIADIGYRAVQVSAVDRAVIPEADIASICRQHGLTICATHEAGDEILEKPQRVVERLQAMGCALTAYPYPRGVDFSSQAAVTQFIKQLDAAGRVLTAAGLTLTYHNHHMEFRRLDGHLILERIYAETNPANLQGELDTYWVQYGGGDPAGWCRRLQGRLPLLHLKDFRINSQDQIEVAEVGSGNLDFPEIIAAAEQAGCKWFIVEQDVCPGNAFDSVANSFRYLSTLVHRS